MLVNINYAKTHFSKLINQVLNGEEIIIAKRGKPIIQLVPCFKKKQTREMGQLKGLVQIAEDFDAPLPDDLLKLFYQDEE